MRAGRAVAKFRLELVQHNCPHCGSPLTTEPDVTPDLRFGSEPGRQLDAGSTIWCRRSARAPPNRCARGSD
jgi:hypothetical protein